MEFWGGRTHVLPFFIHPHLTLRENARKIKPDSWTGGTKQGTCPAAALYECG